MKRGLLFSVCASLFCAATAAAHVGYYRFPAFHENTIVFAAEGDLSVVEADGGAVRRLTTHAGEETNPAIAPDGKIVAFCAQYEGPTEVYTIPIDGGMPTRRTFGSQSTAVVGWTQAGDVLYTTRQFSTLPNSQLASINLATGAQMLIPLSQASDGVHGDQGELFFTRLPFQGSHTKRYKGGTARQIWKYRDGMDEAVPLTTNYPGESLSPMWWRGRVYFVTDRDGTMNIWSMRPDGSDLKQHTRYSGWDVKSPALSRGRIIYQLGAELHLFDLASSQGKMVPITLTSDLDQMREQWLHEPMDYLTAAHLSPDGDRLVLTARGEIFVAPRKDGRFVHLARDSGVRYRQASFMPNGESIVALSDESGEVEFWTLPADGLSERNQLTSDGRVLRFNPSVSPDGTRIAYQDKDQVLWIYNVEDGTQTEVSRSDWEVFSDLAWSPDSHWLAFVEVAANTFRQIRLFHVTDNTTVNVTGDRLNSFSPAWSADGTWLYFLSDRHFDSLVGSPWGAYQPEPMLYRMTKVFVVSLTEERRSPFQPIDELHPEKETKQDENDEKEKADNGADESNDQDADEPDEQEDEEAAEAGDDVAPLELDLDGIMNRAIEVPIPPGEYRGLSVGEKHLYWIASDSTPPRNPRVQALKIGREKPEIKTVAEGVGSYELSLDRKRLLLRKGNAFHIVDAGGGKADLEKSRVDLGRWRFPLNPREEWRQMFVEAWRLERDYFYDPGMHGVDWKAMLEKHLPLVDRVTTRAELSDLIAQMVGELSALHIYVVGGDMRRGSDQIAQASLGARLVRDDAAGGYRIEHIYQADPDFPDQLSPLARPDLGVHEGDIIEQINGTPTLSVADPGVLLRDQVGRQVRLRLRTPGEAEPRDIIVEPISTGRESNLRYGEWEYTRRLMVEELGDGEIGYVHLRAMGGRNYLEWAKSFYPVFDRKGLIVDVRHNQGGNIDSWILEKLMRRAWMYWQARVGKPTWNMQYAFRGHMVVICDERTASDGEAFAEGFRRLGLGKVLGTRTWGGEIWLSFSNRLVDSGIASAAEYGVFGPEGEWLIEGHGVEPDIVVDNLPHTTFNGTDAQLEAAVRHLLDEIGRAPVPAPAPPPYPDKSFGGR